MGPETVALCATETPRFLVIVSSQAEQGTTPGVCRVAPGQDVELVTGGGGLKPDDGTDALEVSYEYITSIFVDFAGNLYLDHADGPPPTYVSTESFALYRIQSGYLDAVVANDRGGNFVHHPVNGLVGFNSTGLTLVSHGGAAVPSGNGDVEIPSPDGSELYVFDVDGKHVRTLSTLTGLVVQTFEYDSEGYLIVVRDRYGTPTTFQRGGAALAGITSADGLQSTATLDGNGYLASLSNSEQETVEFTYDPEGLMSTMTTPAGEVFSFSWHPDGRLQRDTDPETGFQQLESERVTDPVELENLGFEAAAGMDRVTRTTKLGRQTKYETYGFTSGHSVLVEEAPSGTRTQSNTDGEGRWARFYADGTHTLTASEADQRFGSRASKVTNSTFSTPGGKASTVAIDRAAVGCSDGSECRVDPFSFAQLQTSVYRDADLLGTYVFDQGLRRLSSTAGLPNAGSAYVTLDAAEAVETVGVGSLHPLTIARDARGRPQTLTWNNRQVSVTYGVDGFVDLVTDPLGRVIDYEWDGAGRLVSVAWEDGRVLGLDYDANGRVAGVTPPGQPRHGFTRDGRGIVETYEPPVVQGTGNTVWTIDDDRRIASVTRGDGVVVNVTFDQTTHRPTAVGSSEGDTIDVTYAQGNDKVETLAGPSGETLTASYDGAVLEALTLTGEVGGQVEYLYDDDLRFTGLRVNGEEIPYELDALGRIRWVGGIPADAVVGWSTTPASIAYQAGLPEYVSFAGGFLIRSLSYDLFGAVESFSDKWLTNIPASEPGDVVGEPFSCDGGGTTIPADQVCDGSADCQDGSDESLETCCTADPYAPNQSFQAAADYCAEPRVSELTLAEGTSDFFALDYVVGETFAVLDLDQFTTMDVFDVDGNPVEFATIVQDGHTIVTVTEDFGGGGGGNQPPLLEGCAGPPGFVGMPEVPMYWCCADESYTLLKEQVCDGESTCFDGSDESDCANLFQCEFGTEIHPDFVCDGENDCVWLEGSNTDEENCPSTDFECLDGQWTIPQEWVCDGSPDCQDGSDEDGCPPIPQFDCLDGQSSIPETQVCDGFPNCQDGSDEQGCPPGPFDPYECGDGQVVQQVNVCDGFQDCANGADEADCAPQQPTVVPLVLEVKRDAQAGSCGSYAFFGVPAGCDGAAPVDDPPPGQETLNTDTYYSASFTRDLMGRLATMSETVLGQAREYEYVYDDADRLYQVILDGEVVEEYTYDQNGNRLSAMRDGETVFGSYDDQDRMLAHGDLSFVWDGAGDLEQKIDNAANETTSYDYDAFGNLRGVTLPDGTDIEYLVDAMGRRVGKKVDGVLAKGWLYQDALNPVAELDANGDVVSMFAYVSRGHVPDLMYRDAKTYRIISDYRGSVRMVTDLETGKVMQRLEYDAWGRVLVDTNPGFVPFGYAGGLYDPETGLVRFGARDYDAEVGRWTAKDPLGFGATSNLFRYVPDPINYFDATGQSVTAVGFTFKGKGLLGVNGFIGLGFDASGNLGLVLQLGGGAVSNIGLSAGSEGHYWGDAASFEDIEGGAIAYNATAASPELQVGVCYSRGKPGSSTKAAGFVAGVGALPVDVGVGGTYTFTIPLATADEVASAEKASDDAAGFYGGQWSIEANFGGLEFNALW